MQHAPVYKRRLWRPWLWPHKLLAPRTGPIPPGLWLINTFCQRVLGINNEIPWMVHFTSRVMGNISIGKNVWISFAVSGGCYLQGINSIEIGDDTIFAPGVKIISANHKPGRQDAWEEAPPIQIGKSCWIAANAVILPGVILGDNIVVGAGAVVNKSFPQNSKLIGVPAKKISL